MKIPSYGKVLNLGHRDLAELFNSPVIVQEKYDGSQISWAWDDLGELWVTSKGKLQEGGGAVPDKLFEPAIAHLRRLDPARPGARDLIGPVFRGETLATPKHNTVEYAGVPDGHIILFDIEFPGAQKHYWAGPLNIADGADTLSISPAAVLGTFDHPRDQLDMAACDRLLDTESSLGGAPIEGFVVKNYHLTNQRSGRPFLVGKYVSERFKETHKRSWRSRHPGQSDVIERLIAALNTEARWEKAVQHLAESGTLEGSPRDIGALIQEVQADTMAEEAAWIEEKLFEWGADKIRRGLARGLPEWYKHRLAESQFDEPTGGVAAVLAAYDKALAE